MINKFAADLADAFQRNASGTNIKTEGDFEREVAIPSGEASSEGYPAISMFVHPWGSKHCCSPECSTAQEEPGCWAVRNAGMGVRSGNRGHVWHRTHVRYGGAGPLIEVWPWKSSLLIRADAKAQWGSSAISWPMRAGGDKV